VHATAGESNRLSLTHLHARCYACEYGRLEEVGSLVVTLATNGYLRALRNRVCHEGLNLVDRCGQMTFPAGRWCMRTAGAAGEVGYEFSRDGQRWN